MKYFEGAKVPDTGALHYLPYFLIIVANVFWSLSWIHSNEYNINPIQTTVIRAFVMAAWNYVICKYNNYPLDIKTSFAHTVITRRNLLQTVHSMVMASAQFILPLPVVHTISASGVLWVFTLDYLLYGVAINSAQACGIVIGFGGVLLNVNGSLITSWWDPSYIFNSTFSNYITEDPVYRSVFALFMFAVMVGWAYSLVQLKEIREYNSFQTNFHMAIVFMYGGGLAYPALEGVASMGRLAMGLLLTGVPIAIAQMLFIGGITMSKETGSLTMLNFIGVVIGYLVSVFRYHENPNLISIFGMAMVTVGVYVTIFKKG